MPTPDKPTMLPHEREAEMKLLLAEMSDVAMPQNLRARAITLGAEIRRAEEAEVKANAARAGAQSAKANIIRRRLLEGWTVSTDSLTVKPPQPASRAALTALAEHASQCGPFTVNRIEELAEYDEDDDKVTPLHQVDVRHELTALRLCFSVGQDDVRNPDFYLERMRNGWVLVLHRDDGADPLISISIDDNKTVSVSHEAISGTEEVFRCDLDGQELPLDSK